MQSTEALPKRSYILYILFILLSSLLILIDYFSNKELSSYFPNSVNFEFEIENSDFTFIQRFDTLFEQRAQLVSCLLYTSPSPRDAHESRMPSSA